MMYNMIMYFTQRKSLNKKKSQKLTDREFLNSASTIPS